MRRIIAFLIMLASISLITKTNATNGDRTNIILGIQQWSNIDPNTEKPILRKSPIYIPIEATFDMEYLYIKSLENISCTYRIINANNLKSVEGILSIVQNCEKRIDITSLPEGEYKIEFAVGEYIFEGHFYKEE